MRHPGSLAEAIRDPGGRRIAVVGWFWRYSPLGGLPAGMTDEGDLSKLRGAQRFLLGLGRGTASPKSRPCPSTCFSKKSMPVGRVRPTCRTRPGR
jgi:hypothetical protein